jgi:hypothetical protein
MSKVIVHHLPVRLTDEEKTKASERLAAAIQEKDDHEGELGKIKREYKDRDEKLQAEFRYLGRLIRTGVEERAVQCEERPNWLNSTMEIFRIDTGELVNFRPLSREERQRDINWDESDEKH